MEANKQQLSEIKALRKRIAELEELEVEHRKMLKALKGSEEKYRKLFETCPIGITILDIKGMILSCNNAVYKNGGYSEDDLIGKHFSKIAPLNVRDVPKFIKIFNSIIRGKVPKLFEISYQRKDRSTGWTEISISLYKVDGKKLEIQVLQHDITERKQAEEVLKESEERHRTIFETTGTAMLIGEEDTTISMINAEFEKLLGYSKEEVEGKKSWIEFIVKADLERMKEYNRLRMIDQNAAPPYYEFQFIDKQGNVRDCFITVAMIPRTKKFVGSLIDITERKQAEETLRQSERDLRLRNQINNIFLIYPDEEMYAEILKLIRKTMESKYGTFGYFDENGSFVAPAVTRKIYWDKCNVPEKDIIFKKGTFGGIWGRAIKERKTLISNDGSFNTPKGHIRIENTMVTPIIFHEEVISTIHIANKHNGYNEQDRAVLETIADQIAPVLYARLQRDKKDVQRKQAEEVLKKKMHQLELFNKMAVDRELRMVELKKEINSLLEKAGEPKKYMTSL